MKIAIIGGGLTGLSAAYYLSQKGHRITLFEKENQLGGLAAGVEIDGGLVDKYYHHIFAGDRLIIDLIKEVGLGDRLIFKKPQTAIFYQDQIYPFTSALDLLCFTPLSFIDRLRFGIVGLNLKMVADGRKYSTVVAKDWLGKSFGEGSYRVVWEPLLHSKFGEHSGDVSMAWFWSRAHDRSFSLGYLKGGFQVLVNRLREELERRGSTFQLGVPVTSVSSGNGGRIFVSCLTSDSISNKVQFDKVVATAPLPVFLDLVENLPQDYRNGLKTIRFRSALSIILVLRKSFMNCYWLNVNDENFPFVAVVEHTNFVSSADYYNGKRILYIGSYLDQDDSKLKMTDGELFDLYLPYLQKINPNFAGGWVEGSFVFKNDFAQPIVTTDYESKTLPFETPIKNVYLATMAQVYPHDRGMNQAVKLGKDVAEIVEA